jgi:hypothetical protein
MNLKSSYRCELAFLLCFCCVFVVLVLLGVLLVVVVVVVVTHHILHTHSPPHTTHQSGCSEPALHAEGNNRCAVESAPSDDINHVP